MYAIFKHGGKQYKVSQGDYLNLDHFSSEKGASVELSEVLAVCDKELKVGTPFVSGAKITLKVIAEGKDRKVVIFKKRRRKHGIDRYFSRTADIRCQHDRHLPVALRGKCPA